jgi:hypothetical protein
MRTVNYNLIIGCVFSLALIACHSNEENIKGGAVTEGTATLTDFSWLEGTWVDTITFGFKLPPQHVFEEWKVYKDSISGLGYYVQGDDKFVSESFSIVKTETQIVYVARPKNEAVVGFPFKGLVEGQYVFENKAHDFPQKIAYQPFGKDSLHIYLEGITNTVTRKVKMRYFKVN